MWSARRVLSVLRSGCRCECPCLKKIHPLQGAHHKWYHYSFSSVSCESAFELSCCMLHLSTLTVVCTQLRSSLLLPLRLALCLLSSRQWLVSQCNNVPSSYNSTCKVYQSTPSCDGQDTTTRLCCDGRAASLLMPRCRTGLTLGDR